MSTVALRASSGWSFPVLSAGALAGALAVHEAGPAGAPKPRLLDRVRETVRTRHYSRRGGTSRVPSVPADGSP